MRNRGRGSTLVESALVTTVFLIVLTGMMEFGRLGFAYNSVTFAAHRAARYAALRGSASGHAATVADIRSEAMFYITALDTSQVAVAVTWTPDNHPGSTVKVSMSYNFKPVLIPIASGTLSFQSSSSQVIAQ